MSGFPLGLYLDPSLLPQQFNVHKCGEKYIFKNKFSGKTVREYNDLNNGLYHFTLGLTNLIKARYHFIIPGFNHTFLAVNVI